MLFGPPWRHILLGAAAYCALCPSAQAAAPDRLLLPLPVEMKARSHAFHLTGNIPVVVSDDDPQILFAAKWLASSLEKSSDATLPVVRTSTAPATIVFRKKQSSSDLPAEGYIVDVKPHVIQITASDAAGLFYGAVTVSQLVDDGHAVHGAHIVDHPRLSWRGVMLDSVRHFQTPDDIRTLIDAMAALKLNILHWHLTDDQGWRLEIRQYPKLTTVGAWRQSTVSGPQGNGARYGGYYKQDDVRALVSYAAERHITIVPEIEMPGHARAAIAAYPEFGVTGHNPGVAIDYGVLPWLYNVDGATITFIHNVLDEVMALFPSPFIHLGGDEAIKDQWKASGAVQSRIHALGLRDEEQLESWFIEQGGQYLAQHNRRLIGWDEILRGGLPQSASVMSWHGVDGAMTAARAGHDAVVAPEHQVYLDFLQGAPSDRLSGGRYAPETIGGIYNFDPVPAGTDPDVARHILGVEAPVWTEYLTDGAAVQYAAFPRLDALAEIAWSPQGQRQPTGFAVRLAATMRRQHDAGLNISDAPFAVTITAKPGGANGKDAMMTFSTQMPYGTIHYTLDGSTPTATSSIYTSPLGVKMDEPIAAATFDDEGHLLTRIAHTTARESLFTRDNLDLTPCPDSAFNVRVPQTPDATSTGSRFYSIDTRKACWTWHGSPTATHMRITVQPLAWSFEQPPELASFTRYPTPYAHGAILVREDDCKGNNLAQIPLPAMKAGQGQVELPESTLPRSETGRNLCLISATGKGLPYVAIGRITLSP